MKNASTGNTPAKAVAGRTDWNKVRAMKDADIVFTEEAPRTSAKDWEGAVIKRAGKPVGRVRGPQKAPTKTQIAIRLSPQVLAYFRATGAGWQGRIDAALLEWIKTHPAG